MKGLKKLFDDLILSSDQISELKSMYDENIPPFTDEEFEAFSETGSRIEYETKYFLRRRQLAIRFMLCLGDDGYIEKLRDVILAVCNEKTWVLPAHFSGDKTVDLFAAETAQTLAEIKYLIGERLPDDITALIGEKIRERVIEPFEDTVFLWESFKNNWSAVCGGCVGMTLIYEAPNVFEKYKERFKAIMQAYLDGYGDDGACVEGLAYYNYGFGYFMYFAAAYEEYSGNTGTLSDSAKIRAVASFASHMSLGNGVAVSFSDGDRLFTLQKSLADIIRDCFDIPVCGTARFDNCFRFAPFIRSYAYGSDNTVCTDDFTNGKYFPNAEWYIMRGSDFSFAAKGGNNGESHNHNDIGAFIFAVDGEQVITDFGAGEYTREYFSEKRYDNLVCSSLGHSVPIVNGVGQCAGGEYRAKNVLADKKTFSLDMGGAYGFSCEINRRFEITRDGVLLTDRFSDDACDVTERFMMLREPEVNGDTLRIGRTTLDCGIKPVITSTEVKGHDGVLQTLWLADYSVDVSSDAVFKIRLIVSEK